MENRVREMWQVNKYLWICLLFVGLFIPLARAQGWITASLPTAYGVFGLAVLNGALRTYSAWRRGGYNDARGWVFTLGDVLIISIAVHITRGLDSDLWLAYFVILISESLFARPGQAVILLGCIGCGYLAATWPERMQAGYGLTVATRMFFLVIVGTFGRRLSADRERRNREVMALREQVAASDERARIAREIHDGLGHALVASILRLELCSRLVRRDPAEAEKLAREEVQALRAAWNEGRNLAFHLRPWEQEAGGFAHSLRRHISRFAERTGIAVDLQIEEEGAGLSADVELALTRIVQEALTNVTRHAQASEVSVQLKRQDGEIRCVIRDNGVGFAPEEHDGSFGLNAMRERAEKLRGSFRLHTRPDAGTTVEVALPIE